MVYAENGDLRVKYKGIVLAGGNGSRLYPATTVISKHLLPIFNKPMIYHPLSVLMLAGIRDILIIATPHDMPLYQKLLKTGEQWGIHFTYVEQPEPGGLAQALILGESFIGGDLSALILGDNIFYGNNFQQFLSDVMHTQEGATLLAHHVQDPARYGVVEFSQDGNVRSLEEKPKYPKSNYAITGLYFYDHHAVEFAKCLQPSARGELEITDLNLIYLNQGNLKVTVMNRGYTWMDAGTYESLLDASTFVANLERRQGLQLACLEEIAYRQHWIDAEQLYALAQPLVHTEYGEYLLQILRMA